MENSLKPCPLCGGHASIPLVSIGKARFDALIRCDVCGLIGSYFGNTKPNDFCSRGRRKKAGE